MKIQAMNQIGETLLKHNVRLIFISSSNAVQTKEFLASSSVPVEGDLYSDPDTNLYNLYGMLRGKFRSLVMPLFSGIRKYGIKGVIEGVKLGYETSHLAGDSWIQGGTLLLDKDANILYKHLEGHPADWPDMTTVLQMVGISNTTVEYDKAVKDFLKAREESKMK